MPPDVRFKAKMHQSQFPWTPLRELTCSAHPDLLAVFKGLAYEERGGKGKEEGNGKEKGNIIIGACVGASRHSFFQFQHYN